MTLEYVRKQRGLLFLKVGMRVKLEYGKTVKHGVITGGNSSGNINVRFDGETHSKNCHPKWAITYYDDNGEIIKQQPES